MAYFKKLEEQFDPSGTVNEVFYYGVTYTCEYLTTDTPEEKAVKFGVFIGSLRADKKAKATLAKTVAKVAATVKIMTQNPKKGPKPPIPAVMGNPIDTIEFVSARRLHALAPRNTIEWAERFDPEVYAGHVGDFLERFAPYEVLGQNEAGQTVYRSPSPDDWQTIQEFVFPRRILQDEELFKFLEQEYEALKRDTPAQEGDIVSFILDVSEGKCAKVLTWDMTHYAFIMLSIAQIFASRK